MDKRHNRIQWENKRTKNINLLCFVKKICDEYDEQKNEKQSSANLSKRTFLAFSCFLNNTD